MQQLIRITTHQSIHQQRDLNLKPYSITYFYKEYVYFYLSNYLGKEAAKFKFRNFKKRSIQRKRRPLQCMIHLFLQSERFYSDIFAIARKNIFMPR